MPSIAAPNSVSKVLRFSSFAMRSLHLGRKCPRKSPSAIFAARMPTRETFACEVEAALIVVNGS